MSTLLHEISTLTDTSPGEFDNPQWGDHTEVAFKDYGSRRAALVALGACGQLVAIRDAEERVTAVGGQFRADGTDAVSNQAIHDAQDRVKQVRGFVAGFDMSIGNGNLNNRLALGRHDADVMIDAMEALPKLDVSEQDDITKYYAAVIPSLLETAVLSVDGANLRIEM